MNAFNFAIIADSHIRLPSLVDEGGYASNAVACDRNRFIVDHLNQLKPDFVIHLGDIVHPIPALSSHEDAVKLARDIYKNLDAPLYLIPGNHDIGDKHNAWMPAPIVDDQSHQIYEKHWGPLYQSFDHGDCHFVMLDTPVMNSGLPREAAQKKWLETDLKQNHKTAKRLFVMVHYPLFLYAPDEVKHYDNIEEPARSWLMGLLKKYHAEAVFSGHVHNFFYNRCQGTDHYIVPSTAFVRPEYAELSSIGPGAEFGRDDDGKLGFFMVHVERDGHQIHPLRSWGRNGKQEIGEHYESVLPKPSLLGVRLRHSWATAVELTTDGLDEFTRKKARRDGLLQALWELNTEIVSVPIDDLMLDESRTRMADLAHRGQRFVVSVIGLPTADIVKILAAADDIIWAVEVVVPEFQMYQAVDTLGGLQKKLSVPVYVAPVVSFEPTDSESGTFQHFASHGFSATNQPRNVLPDKSWNAFKDNALGVTFRLPQFSSPWQACQDITALCRENQLPALVNVGLPRLNEGVNFANDEKIANYVTETWAAAVACPELTLIFDTFMDHDRGYYPRHGLIDRRFNPRVQFMVLKNLQQFSALLGPDLQITKRTPADQNIAEFLIVADKGQATLMISTADQQSAIDNFGNKKIINLQSGQQVPDIQNKSGPFLVLG